MKKYIPLHCHSHYSLLDGLSKPYQIGDRCEKINAKACALTDHGNIAGAVKFHTEMKSRGIKPILGCEIYLCHKDPSIKDKNNKSLSHFIVLAKNLSGWRQLIQIVSRSNSPDFYYHKPRIDIDTLSEYCDGNIIGFCGHLGSLIADQIAIDNSISSDWKNIGIRYVGKLKEIFGKENFFLESQLMDSINTPFQKQVNSCIREIAHMTNTRVICTPDAHYAEKQDAIDQRVLLCNNIKTTFPNISRKIQNKEAFGMSCFFESDNFHILSQEEMSALHTEEEIDNTNIVADMCEEYEISHKPRLPQFKCPKDFDPDTYLRELCRHGWKEKISSNIEKDGQFAYLERIKSELDVLQSAKLSSYFLIVQDIVNYVKSQQWLPGPGRGSAAGCLVSYLIGITNIDPIKYNLLFDRFYNAGRNTDDRISMPDIDVDVPINKRENVIDYIKHTYGENKVSQMITFNTIKGRGALKDVLRAYGNIGFEEMNKITKNIPDESKIADELQEMKDDTGEASIIKWSLENNADKLKEWCYYDSDGVLRGPLSKRFEQAIRLEGTKSNQSKHAAGVVIADTALAELCPMIYDTKTKQNIAGMEMQDLESIGIIKFDILGVAMLDKIMTIQELLFQGV